MKFCPKCGAQLNGNENVCPQCGYQLEPAADTVKTVKTVNKTENKKTGTHKKGGLFKAKTKKGRKWVRIIAAIIVIILGYSFIYVPSVVNSSLKSNGLTAAHGYKVSVNAFTRTINIKADTARNTDFNSQLRANGFDTEMLPVENSMSNVAHDIAGRTIGTWTITMSDGSKHVQNQRLGNYWVFTGTRETKRFQTSSAGREARREYLAMEERNAEQKEQNDEDNEVAAGLAGGALGGAIGYMLGE